MGWRLLRGPFGEGNRLPIAYRFLFLCAVLPDTSGWWALIKPSRIGLASTAGLPNADDRFLYGAVAICASVRGPWRVSLTSGERSGQED